MNLFTYGTLMFDEVMHQVAGESYRSCPAQIIGYSRRKVKSQTYPALIKGGDTIDGRIYFDITPPDLARLDAFEGAYYDRRPVTAITDAGHSVSAEVYELNPAHYDITIDEIWTPDEFARNGLQDFLNAYFGFEALKRK